MLGDNNDPGEADAIGALLIFVLVVVVPLMFFLR
jgi:hypothetical protein